LSAERARTKALFLDLGKVLVDYDWPSTLANIAEALPQASAEELDRWSTEAGGTIERYASGRIGSARFLTEFHERFDPERTVDDGWLAQRWCDMFVAIPGAFELIDTLRGRVRLSLLSNTNSLHFAWLDAHHRLRARFDDVVLSHEIGMLKPEAAFYTTALEHSFVVASDAFFVDDLPENVEGAAAVGIPGAVFTGIADLRLQLAALGIA